MTHVIWKIILKYMYSLDQSTIKRWVQFNSFWFPESVSTNCPFCAEKVNFATTLFDYDPGTDTISSRATCPNCGETVYIWGIHPGLADDPLKKGCACVAMFPAPQLSRQPIEGSDLIPDRVRKAYLDTIGAFNAGIWSLTAGSCRRTLEGILSNISSQSKTKGALANQIQQLTENIDLQQPLITLADAVRTGGNIGAHFDAEKEADQETAQVLLDLIEYLLEYVYTLPGMVEKLNKRIATLGKTPDSKKATNKGKQGDEAAFLQELATKKTIEQIKSPGPDAERSLRRLKFWQQLLERAKEKGVMTHSMRSPSRDSWISAGAGKSGLKYNYIIIDEMAAIDLEIDTGDYERNKRIFDTLQSKRKKIEADFGETLSWEPIPASRGLRIIFHIENGGIKSKEENWSSIQDRMINAMDRFVKALAPFIQELPN